MPTPEQKRFDECVIAGQLSARENLAIYRDQHLFEVLSENAFRQKFPVAIILGGQNASGKSTLGEQFLQRYEKNGAGIVRIEGDALREHHPLFARYNRENDKLMAAYTARDSGEWTRRLIEDAGKSRMNMLIETTMRSPDAVSETASRLTESGYDVQVKIFVVSYEKSLTGCYERYETMKAARGAGRFVYEHSLNAAYQGMPKTIQRLQQEKRCSCIHLYTRECILFEGDYRTAQVNIADIVKQERIRDYTEEEISFLTNRWNQIIQMMMEREAGKEEFVEALVWMENRLSIMLQEGVAIQNIRTLESIRDRLKRITR